MSDRSGVKYTTLEEAPNSPIEEEPEEGNAQNALLLPAYQLGLPGSTSKVDLRQGDRKKFFANKSDQNLGANSRSPGGSKDNLNNDGNNNDKEDPKSGTGYAGPGPGSGDTKGGSGVGNLDDSGRGSSNSQELVFYFKRDKKDEGDPSDAESTGFGMDNLNEDGNQKKVSPKPDKKKFRPRFLSDDRAELLPGDISSEDEGAFRPTSPRAKPKYSERLIERKGYASDTSSIHSGHSLPGSPSMNRLRQFTVVNYGNVQATPELARKNQADDIVLPAVTKKISPVHTPIMRRSPVGSLTNFDQKKVNLLELPDGPSPGSSPRSSFSGSFYSQNLKNFTNVAKRGLLFAKRKKDRILNKSGSFNVSFRNISNRRARFLQDVYTTVLDASWFTTIMIFVIAFCLTWIGFGLLWWFIAFYRGDVGLSPDDTHKCVDQVHNWVSAFLFSLETQHTIGYGVRAITEECPEAVLLLMMQSMVGVLSQCIVTGFIFSKLARPRGRGRTIMFSRNAVICQEDGEYCLIFRVGDMRHSQLVGAMLHAMFIKQRITQEGHEIPFHQYHLEVHAESEDYDQFIFLSWPIRVIHRITPNSPLWGVSAEQLLAEDFEIIVILEGVVEATSMTTQVRTSYLPTEILWGHSLAPLLTCRKGSGQYDIDFAQFHQTVPVTMPEESAADYYERTAAEEAEETDGETGNKSALNGNIPAINLIPPIQRALIEEQARRMSTVPHTLLSNLGKKRDVIDEV